MLDATRTPTALHTCASLAEALAPLAPARLATLTTRATDPAGLLPTYATQDQPPVLAEPVMDVETIEAALLAHVREGTCAKGVIRAAFHPFADDTYITVEPGKGQQRPSYAFSIDALGINCLRASTRTIAEGIHRVALNLSAYAVGNRAPEGSPTFTMHGTYRHTAQRITASDYKTARKAFIAATGRSPSSVEVTLPTTLDQVVEYVRAARCMLANKAMGQDDARNRAMALVRAVHDLRIATTVLLRQCTARRYVRHNITLRPSNGAITISDGTTAVTAHEKMQAMERYNTLNSALMATMDAHAVLRTLPDSWEITLDGENNYLSVEIEDTAATGSSFDRRIRPSTISYESIPELAELLATAHQPKVQDEESTWLMVLEGRTRSAHTWTLTGQTFAEGLVAKVRENDSRSSDLLIDLLIDLLAPQDCEDQPQVSVFRIF